MRHPMQTDSATQDPDFDYSTPEAQEAMRGVTSLILEIREEVTSPMARRMALYERTLGLAVIPVLLRRAAIMLGRRAKRAPRGSE